ncbi:chemotaxis protein CheW [Actinoplanes sp. NPDC049599]|jgi:purine-binding chemotaxis protein CheW|uniref:chemotaxis protein CheW n=1 Tax=Actinoplanes sp. NPDC049599 TaxID=3363903 RepID=UPI0037A11A26
MASRQFATFEVADQLFGVEVHTVQEVLSYNEYTPVPLAPPAVGGLFNLRGQVIAAVDLRVQLGLVRQAMQGPVMNVILRGDGEPVSLLVDRIGEVVDLDDEAFEGPPDTLAGHTRELVTGTFKMDGRLMLALDVNRAVDTSRATT